MAEDEDRETSSDFIGRGEREEKAIVEGLNFAE